MTTPMRGTAILLAVATLASCHLSGARPTQALDPTEAAVAPSTLTHTPTNTLTVRPPAPDTPHPSPISTETPIPEEEWTIGQRERATMVLERWADAAAEFPPDPVILVYDQRRGGGWRGRGAGDRKLAFMAGAIESIAALPSDVPAPRDVTWPDGSRQTVELISAADAFDEMVARGVAVGGGCSACDPLQVVGAKLAFSEVLTSRGEARVPAWQFEFTPEDAPTTPITYAAIRNPVVGFDYSDWHEGGPELGGAYGAPTDTELSVIYMGSACATGYTGEAVESNEAIVLIVGGIPQPERSPGPCIAMAVGYLVTVSLEEPIGDRVVLDLWSGFPVPLRDEEPPELAGPPWPH